jgi:hypothetical protein
MLAISRTQQPTTWTVKHDVNCCGMLNARVLMCACLCFDLMCSSQSTKQVVKSSSTVASCIARLNLLRHFQFTCTAPLASELRIPYCSIVELH